MYEISYVTSEPVTSSETSLTWWCSWDMKYKESARIEKDIDHLTENGEILCPNPKVYYVQTYVVTSKTLIREEILYTTISGQT